MKHKTLRQILALVLVVMMLVPNFTIPTFADNTAKWSVGSGTVAPGGTITVPIMLENSPEFMGVAITINYDSTVLTLNDIKVGDDTPAGFEPSLTPSANYCALDAGGDVAVPASAQMFLLEFSAKENAEPGTYEITLDLSDGFYNKAGAISGANIPFTVVPGTITVDSGNPKVAEIVGGAKYDTIQAAVNAAGTTPSTIKLLMDVTQPCTSDVSDRVNIQANQEITLDLNGHALNGYVGGNSDGGDAVIINRGKLVVKDTVGTGSICGVNSEWNVTTSSGNKYYVNNDYGFEGTGDAEASISTLGSGNTVIEGGVIKSFLKYNSCDGASITINGGTVIGAISGSGTVQNMTININGGTIYSAYPKAESKGEQTTKYNYSSVQVYHGTTLNMSGGILYGNIQLEGSDGHRVNISGGTIDTCDPHLDDYYAALGELTYDPSYRYDQDPVVNFASATEKTGKISVTGGSFRGTTNGSDYRTADNLFDATDAVPAGYSLIGGAKNDGWYKLSKVFTMSIALPEGGAYFPGETINATIYAAPKDGVIGNFQFTVKYDPDKLEFASVAPQLSIKENSINETDGTYACVIDGEGAKITGDDFAIAKVVFNVKDITECGSSEISLENAIIGEVNGITEPAEITVAPVTASLHKFHTLVVSTDGHSKINGSDADKTLYYNPQPMKSAGVGFYTDTTFATKVDDSIFTPDSGYKFVDGAMFKSGTTVTYAGLADNALTTKASNNCDPVNVTLNTEAIKYDFYPGSVADKYTVTATAGVSADGKVTVENDITFNVAPANEGQPISTVTYKIGENGTSTSDGLTKNADGSYTIAKEKITGDVYIIVELNESVKITFKAGPGAVFTETALYAQFGKTSKLYSNNTLTSEAQLPTYTAAEGYRVPTGTEYLWYTSNDNGATAVNTYVSLDSANFKADTVLYAHAIKTYTITFATDGNGSVNETSRTVDARTTINGYAMPTCTPNTGYEFDKWTWSSESATVDSDMTATAHFKKIVYTFSVPTVTAYTVAVTGATDNGNGTYSAEYGAALTVTITPAADKALTNVEVKNGDIAVTPTSTDNGVYTYSFTVAGTPSVSVETYDTVTVTVAAGNGGSVTPTSIVVKKSEAKTDVQDQVTATANPGYTFSNWSWNIDGETVETSATLTANFALVNYDVKVNGESIGKTANCENAFTLDKVNVSQVYFVTGATVNGEAVAYTVNADGNYVVAAGAITGELNFTATVISATVLFTTTEEDYACPTGEKMVRLQATNVPEGKKLQLNGEDFFWSSKYDEGSYVMFVDAAMTAQEVLQKLQLADGTAVSIAYEGDISGNGNITSVDGGIINDVLQNNLTAGVSDLMRFEMDVTGDLKVTTQDIQWILNKVVGLS